MSKNTDFFKLGPYSRKNSIRTGIGTKIGATESKRAKLAVPRALTRQQRAGSAWSRAREGTSCGVHARPPPRSHGSVGPVRSGRLGSRCGSARLAGDTCRRLAGAALLQRMVDACPAPVAVLHRSPADSFFLFFLSFFLLSSLPSENRNTVLFSDFHIFRFVDRIDMIPSVKF